LARLFPAAEISVLAAPRVAPLFQGHPAVVEILCLPAKGLFWSNPERWRLVQELRRRRFDLALLLPNSFDSALIMWLAGIPHRIGYATDCRSPLLTTVLQGVERLAGTHQVYRYLGLLQAFAHQQTGSIPRLYLTPHEMAQGLDLLTAAGLDPQQGVVGISPGATYGTAKQWSPERFAQVATQLQAEFEAGIVILGGEGDLEAAHKIAAQMPRRPLNLVGQTDLRTAMKIINQLQLLITNDSGLMHVAAAFGVPLVAIFGPTDPMTTAPFTSLASLVRSPVSCSPCLKRHCPEDHICMANIAVAEVTDQARFWLKNRSPGAGVRESNQWPGTNEK
jgi:heptosyltransferase-2